MGLMSAFKNTFYFSLAEESVFFSVIYYIGYLLWILYYIILIRRGFIDKRCGVSMLYLCICVPWGFFFAFIEMNNRPELYVFRLWFCAELMLLYQFIKFREKDFPWGLPEKMAYPLFVLGMSVCFFGIVCFTYQYGDFVGSVSGFGISALIPILFMAMVLMRNSIEGQSVYVILVKLAADVCLCYSAYLFMPPNKLANFFYINNFVFDLIYLRFFWQWCRDHGIQPLKRL
jgi:hypothetical protein